jgi:hypothetical protein
MFFHELKNALNYSYQIKIKNIVVWNQITIVIKYESYYEISQQRKANEVK